MYIGIDLGTCNSVIAGVHDGAAQIFRPADGGEALPSVIFIDKRGHRLYGRRAYDQVLLAPENVASGFKRLLGTTTPIDVAGQTLSPEECAAEIIRQLLGQATTELGTDKFDGVILSTPSSFDQLQREALLRAAKLAGLEQVDFIQEPVAAAMAAMADAKRSGKFIIYDMGGGTFDLALVESDHGEIKILAQEGVSMLGGRDFDRLIVHEVVRPWLLANFDLPENFLRDPQFKRLARIAQQAAERAKIELSTSEEVSIFASDDEIRLTDESETEIFLDAPITRAQFEELIRTPVQNTIELIKQTLEENGVAPADVDRIVFVGGPSRIPFIRQQVTESLGIAADLKVDALAAVAQGAAYYCESRKWNGKENAVTAFESSVPKATEGHTTSSQEPTLSFDYAARTPDEQTSVTILSTAEAKGRRIRLMTDGWDSGMLPLENGMSVTVPLQVLGDNVFEAQLMDEAGAELHDHAEKITITRLVAAPAALTAAHSVALKVRKSIDSDENSFLFLINKGDALPASGQARMKSATSLKGGAPGAIGFEVFQVEYPDRVELNLCVGAFRVDGADLPKGQTIRANDEVIFDWRMNEGGVLQASVQLPTIKTSLQAQHYYVPQAAEISFKGETGQAFAHAVLARAEEEWGDLAAALGPQTGPDAELLQTRLVEQKEILEESLDDPEMVRAVSDEARFIRQDIQRLARKYMSPLLQRQLGKLVAAFNRIARSKSEETEAKAFDDLAEKVQKILDTNHEVAFPGASLCLTDMRRLFFAAAWRNPRYVQAWFDKLSKEGWQFADQTAFAEMVEKGRALMASNDQEALKQLVVQMMNTRMLIGASDAVSELATVVNS